MTSTGRSATFTSRLRKDPEKEALKAGGGTTQAGGRHTERAAGLRGAGGSLEKSGEPFAAAGICRAMAV